MKKTSTRRSAEPATSGKESPKRILGPALKAVFADWSRTDFTPSASETGVRVAFIGLDALLIRDYADARRVTPEGLVRQWVHERMLAETRGAIPTPAPSATVPPPRSARTRQHQKRPRARTQKGPTHAQVVREAMGADTLTLDQIAARLNTADQLPQSKDINGYLSLILSTHGELFERVARGKYRVKRNRLRKDEKAAASAPSNGSRTNGHSNGHARGHADVLDSPFAGLDGVSN